MSKLYETYPVREPALGGFHVAKIVTTTQADAEKSAKKWIKQNWHNCFARKPIICVDTANDTWYAIIQWVAFY